jgi:hypothetical protein
MNQARQWAVKIANARSERMKTTEIQAVSTIERGFDLWVGDRDICDCALGWVLLGGCG